MAARKIASLFLMCYLVGALSAKCQEPLVKRFTVEDGLLGNEIYETYQDKLGYIWIATDQGVARYDGHSFQSFSTQNGLLDNTVLGIYEDWKGRIWFPAFYGGLTYYEKGEVHEYRFNDALKKALPNRQMDRLYVDSQETVWIAPLKGGLLRIDSIGDTSWQHTGKDISYQYVKRFTTGEVLSGVSACEGGGPRFKKGKNQCYIEDDDLVFSRDIENFGHYIGEAICNKPNEYVLGISNRIFKVRNTQLVDEYLIGDGIRSIFIDKEENIWACASTGLYFFEQGDFSKVKVWFAGQEVSHVMQDREGGYWISSITQGVFYMPSRHRFLLAGSFKGEGGQAISAIDVEGRNLAVCYSAGTVEIRSGILSPSKVELWSPAMENLTELAIWKGKVYAGNYSRQLFVPETEEDNYLRLGTLKDLYKTEKNLLYSLSSGICIESENGEQEVLKSYATPYRASAIAQIHDGSIWVGTRFGLFTYEGNELKAHPSDLKHRVSDIVLGPDNSVWVLTAGNGVFIYVKDNVYELNDNQELSNHWCNRGFFDEKSGTMWIGTTGGLNKVVVETWSPFKPVIRQLNIYNALPSNEIMDVQQLEDTLLIATNRAVVCIPPLGLADSIVVPQVQMEGLWINQKWKQVFDSERLELLSNENELRFRFVGLSFKGRELIKYRYQLQGQDNDWIESYEREIRYTNLAPGEYSFMVSASNAEGVWNAPRVLSSFIIDTHISDEWWFRTVLLLLLLLVIVGIVRVIIRSQRVREETKRQILLAEQKALRAQMNPHFMFNSLNAIQLYITRNQELEANRYLSSFSKLMRLVLDSSAKRLVSLREELETIRLYLELEELRFSGDISTHIDLAPELDQESIYIPPMLLQPLLENAIWHGLMPKGEQGQVVLKIYERSDFLVCEVLDNGVGRERALEIKGKRHGQKKSVGLDNIRERLSLAYPENKKDTLLQLDDLYVAGMPTGTKVVLLIPLKRLGFKEKGGSFRRK